ncbi:MAG: peptidase M3, partial [Bacteroidales bacterium]|nr:peptidase M3 [Bacteroidales bacterium]
MKKILTIMVIATTLVMTGCNKKQQVADNPFMKEWETPYGVPPFDEIKTEHYLPAIEEGMKQQSEEIAAIVDNTEDPTFENTILALENSGSLLNKVTAVFFNLAECMNSPEMEAIAEEAMPKLSAHSDNINLSEGLFKRVKAVYEQRESLNLNPEQMRLLEETYKGFVRGGANIAPEHKGRLRDINEKLASLTLKFGNNVLKATNDYKLVVEDVNE